MIHFGVACFVLGILLTDVVIWWFRDDDPAKGCQRSGLGLPFPVLVLIGGLATTYTWLGWVLLIFAGVLSANAIYNISISEDVREFSILLRLTLVAEPIVLAVSFRYCVSGCLGLFLG